MGVYVLVLMLMAPTDHCDEHIYVPVGGRWSAPVARDRSCSVATVHTPSTPSLAAPD